MIPSAQNLLVRAPQLREEGRNEAVLRSEFQSWLRRVFPDAADQAWMNHYSESAEAHTRVRETRGGYGHNFVDTLIRRTVIEYESDLRITARFDHGREQVREYAAGAVNAGIPISQIRGVLSDTVEWYVFDVDVRSGITAGHCTRTWS